MREGAGHTRRVRRHGGFAWGALGACDCGGGACAASVPWSLGAGPARLAAVSPGRRLADPIILTWVTLFT